MTQTDIDRIRARHDAATADPNITRYDHGGGRMWIDHPEGRELIADLYDEPNREFYYRAHADVEALLQQLDQLRQERDELRGQVVDLADLIRFTLKEVNLDKWPHVCVALTSAPLTLPTSKDQP